MPFGFSARPVQIATAASPTLMVQTCSLPPHAPCRLQRTTICRQHLVHTLPPHAPCRLQHERRILCRFRLFFASTRSVQIATEAAQITGMKVFIFASTRSVQIATIGFTSLLLSYASLPPHAPCRLQPPPTPAATLPAILCLHTLRADCNITLSNQAGHMPLCLHTLRADCNYINNRLCYYISLCLHTLRADCNCNHAAILSFPVLCLHTLRADCNCRNAQNCNIHFSERVLSW